MLVHKIAPASLPHERPRSSGSQWADIQLAGAQLSVDGRAVSTLNVAIWERDGPVRPADLANWTLADDLRLVVDMCNGPLDIDDRAVELLADKLAVLDLGMGCLADANTLPAFYSKLTNLQRLRVSVDEPSFTLQNDAFDGNQSQLHSLYIEGTGEFTMEPRALSPVADTLTRLSVGPRLTVNESMFEALDAAVNLKKLNLDGIRLRSLPPGALSSLGALEELWLQKNDLKILEKGALRGLVSLKELHLEVNLLESIAEGTFLDTPNLEILKLRGNYLVNLTNETFAGLEGLLQLDLAYNEFDIIPDYVFLPLKNLRHLDLGARKPSYSQIDAIRENSFAGLDRLEQLNLTSTNLAEIPEAALSHLQSVKIVNVSSANISELSDSLVNALENLSNLETFDLTENKVLCNANYSALLNDDIFVVDKSEDLCTNSRDLDTRAVTTTPKPSTETAAQPTDVTSAESPATTTRRPPTTTEDPAVVRAKRLRALVAELLGTNSGAVVVRTEKETGDESAQWALLRHAELMTRLSRMPVPLDGRNWTLADMCLKVRSPKIKNKLIKSLVEPLLEKFIPCVIITPLDCYWDGAKPLGPHPPVVIPEGLDDFLPGLPSGNVTWTNLELDVILKSLKNILGGLDTNQLKASLGGGYVRKPCLDPLDAACPTQAANHFDECAAVEWLADNGYIDDSRANDTDTGRNGTDAVVELVQKEVLRNCGEGDYDQLDFDDFTFTGRKKRSAVDDLLSSYYGKIEEEEKDPCVESDKSQQCRAYGDSLRSQLRSADTLYNLLPARMHPQQADVRPVLTEGCPSLAQRLLRWRPEYLVDATKNNSSPILTGKHMECLVKRETVAMYQSIVLFASNDDALQRIKKSSKEYKKDSKKANDVLIALPSEWFNKAHEVIEAFKRETEIDACASDVSNKMSGEILRYMIVDPSLLQE